MSLERNLDEKGSVSAAWGSIDFSVLQEECIVLSLPLFNHQPNGNHHDELIFHTAMQIITSHSFCGLISVQQDTWWKSLRPQFQTRSYGISQQEGRRQPKGHHIYPSGYIQIVLFPIPQRPPQGTREVQQLLLQDIISNQYSVLPLIMSNEPNPLLITFRVWKHRSLPQQKQPQVTSNDQASMQMLSKYHISVQNHQASTFSFFLHY